MFENVLKFFKGISKKKQIENQSKDTAKERLHLVLMQDRANVSADFLELMKQEIIEVIKKYVEVDEEAIDVRLTNKSNDDGTNGAPALYANIPIVNIRNDMKKEIISEEKEKQEEKKQEKSKTEKTENKQEVEENKEETKTKGEKQTGEKKEDKNKTEMKKNETEKTEKKQEENKESEIKSEEETKEEVKSSQS